MKLHWVELENWRQHTKTKIEIDDETTVIYGPNETGKSTLLEALSRGFFDKSSSSAESIKRIKPKSATGNVTSTVCMVFALNNKRYQVKKDFNLRKGTWLYIIEGSEKKLLAQDNTADTKLIELLDAVLPSKGTSKPSQWGAFQWLWVPQENRELPTDKEGDPTTALHLETKDRGDVLVTPKFQSVQSSVLTSYAQYFSRTGKTTKDSPIKNIEEEIQNLEKTSFEHRNKIEIMNSEKQQLEELQKHLPILKRKVEETIYELDNAKKESAEFPLIETLLKASKTSVNEAERDVKDAENALKELKDSADNIEELQKKENQARKNFSKIEALCEQLDEKHKEKTRTVEEKAEKIRLYEELTRDARILWTKSDTMQKIEELEKKIIRIKNINKKIEILRKKEVSNVPYSMEIENVIQWQIHNKALKESLTERGLAVKITPGEKDSLEVEIDGERITDGKLTATGTERVSVSTPSMGNVTVKAKLEKARDAKSDIMNLEKRIKDMLSKYSVNSIDNLKELSRIQNEISGNLKELIAEIKGVDERSTSEIIHELEKLKEKYEQIKHIKRTPNAIKLNLTEVDLGELVNKREKEEEKGRDDLDIARNERDEIYNELTVKKQELAKLRAGQDHVAEDLSKARIQQQEVIRKFGSEVNQQKILKSAEINLEEQTEDYKKIKQQFEDLEKGPINKIQRLEQQLENQDQVLRNQRTAIDKLEERISSSSLEGTYSELAESESRVEILRERLKNEKIKAESYKLLKDALEQQYRSALSVVVGPVQEEVKRSLGYVTGFLHEDVELNKFLFPTRLGERGFEELSLEFDDSSSGLKEVLTLCVRLAVAKHLSERDSQCLVLDDPFVHVSTDRSNKMIELINEAIKEYKLQLIVFTHRPMEFAGLNGKMVDIQSLK